MINCTGYIFDLIKILKIDDLNYNKIVEFQRENNCSFEDALIDLGYIKEDEMLHLLQDISSFNVINLNEVDLKEDVFISIPTELVIEYKILPIEVSEGEFKIASYTLKSISSFEAIKVLTKKQARLYLCKRTEFLKLYHTYFMPKRIKSLSDQILNNNFIGKEINNFDSPVIDLVENILKTAVIYNSSDIHIEPMLKSFRIRYRIDGELVELFNFPIKIFPFIIGRLKILSQLDISEKRLPQDGRIVKNILGILVDFRVSTIPTIHGEKMVIRVLKKSNINLDRLELGFRKDEEIIIKRLMNCNRGLILISGPTGSGKTTTLYSLLNDLNRDSRNIVTIEDPVEYMIEGINQININTKIGLDFSTCLKSVLRQDPDIIMVGEIRDSETAKIAVRAAITGHLVLSTIHTNDSASAFLRLIDMGVEPYLVCEAIKGIIAQRLVRRICTRCKTEYIATNLEKQLLGVNKDEKVVLYKGTGCRDCQGTGYKGRIGVFEILEIDRELRDMIIYNLNIDILRDLCINKGMKTLKNSCRELVLSGVTTVEEMIKNTFNYD
ncbi:GspE/PulE family protein [Thermobrachium celere]|uniref:Type IV fimbrial assembly, ATPase PilB n=1 Tax=Thermobrachium celere DSM 8682 TaxID=941824 RepID=R7RPV6_9CLOT|nr:GspE/PulE family protein [Thermobrachium celere]CDF58237.1 Type IV fimbrial assembly, ATPase PilB [Thermobrachium celere DSM 8682]